MENDYDKGNGVMIVKAPTSLKQDQTYYYNYWVSHNVHENFLWEIKTLFDAAGELILPSPTKTSKKYRYAMHDRLPSATSV